MQSNQLQDIRHLSYVTAICQSKIVATNTALFCSIIGHAAVPTLSLGRRGFACYWIL